MHLNGNTLNETVFGKLSIGFSSAFFVVNFMPKHLNCLD